VNEATATINLAALRHNFSRVQALAPDSPIIAMIKSNAYGHGLIQVAHTLKQADMFGVARLREALLLREAAITQDILLMPGFLTAEQLPIISVNNLQVVIHTLEQVEMLEAATLCRRISVWLKIDTGMGRLGFLLDEACEIQKRLQECQNVDVLNFITHLATIDDPDHQTTTLQFERLDKAKVLLSGNWSVGKSAAILRERVIEDESVRPGIMLYGISPLAEKTAQELDLQAVMTLQAPIISIKRVKKGEPIGYGSTFICPEDMPVGVIGIGYGDGYPRHAKQGTPVLVNEQLAPRIGRVCMDMMMIDLRGVDNVAVGDSVTLWGEGLPVECIAENAETIAYELLCSVTKRVQFNYQH
jgi:alanine racemase